MSAQHMPNWSKCDPALIANTCSQRHVQSVIEDAQRDLVTLLEINAKLLAALEAFQAQGDFHEWHPKLHRAIALARGAIAEAKGLTA